MDIPRYFREAKRRIRGFLLSKVITKRGKRFRVDKGVRISSTKGAYVEIGNNVRFYENVSIQLISPISKVIIGDNTFLNRRVEIVSVNCVTIGMNCAISWDVQIMDSDFHQLNDVKKTASVVIGNHVWIGCRAVILKGVQIGDGSVIAAGSVVVSDIPEGCLAAGVPAKIVRSNISWK